MCPLYRLCGVAPWAVYQIGQAIQAYSADIAQKDYDYKASNKGAPIKLGKDYAFAAYIEDRILKDRLSPDVIIGRLKHENKNFQTSICTRTLYSYIDKGIFLNVTNKDLYFKGQAKRGYKHVKRAGLHTPIHKIITERPSDVNKRLSPGHWEMDTVIGKRAGKGQVLLVLTERYTRYEFIIKLKSKTQLEVKKALDKLERRYLDFKDRFKTITVDNGSEFLDPDGIENSVRHKGQKRTTVYYCHPYSSWERGSNENQNKLIRRHIPKSTNIEKFSVRQIQDIENWMNNLPRKILNYRTPSELYNLHISSL